MYNLTNLLLNPAMINRSIPELVICEHTRDIGTISDSFPHMWPYVAAYLNTTYRIIKTRSYGSYENHKWGPSDSSMAMLIRGQCNITEPMMLDRIRLQFVDAIPYFYSWTQFAMLFNKQLIAYDIKFEWLKVLKLYEWISLLLVAVTSHYNHFKLHSFKLVLVLEFVVIAVIDVLYNNRVLQFLIVEPKLPFKTLIEAVQKARTGETQITMPLSDVTTTLWTNMDRRQTKFFEQLANMLSVADVHVVFKETEVIRLIQSDKKFISGNIYSHSLRLIKKVFPHGSNVTTMPTSEISEALTPLIPQNYSLKTEVTRAFMLIAQHGIALRYSGRRSRLARSMEVDKSLDKKALPLNLLRGLFVTPLYGFAGYFVVEVVLSVFWVWKNVGGAFRDVYFL